MWIISYNASYYSTVVRIPGDLVLLVKDDVSVVRFYDPCSCRYQYWISEIVWHSLTITHQRIHNEGRYIVRDHGEGNYLF